MNKCTVCGGMLGNAADGVVRCRFCGATYQEKTELQAAREVAVPRRANGGVNVFERNINGILEITSAFDGGQCAGSGFIIDENGFAITNAHVVSNNGKMANRVTVRICGRQIKAEVVRLGDKLGGMGRGVDLALLKINGIPNEASPLSFGDFNATKNGEQVFVIGNSLGDGTCITSGIVSDRCRNLNGQRMLMTDCAINGGNSGGPIFNSFGEVIGVMVCSRLQSDGSGTEGMNYAIPSDTVERFICGELTEVNLSGRSSYTPARYTSCPECGTSIKIASDNNCKCLSCGNRWKHNIK